MNEVAAVLTVLVGTENKPLVGKYSDGKLSITLSEPTPLGTLRGFLERYGVDVGSFPEFAQKILALEVVLCAVDYGPKLVGTMALPAKTDPVNIEVKDLTPTGSESFPTDLTNTQLVTSIAADKTTSYKIQKDSKDLNQYSVTMSPDKKTLQIERKIYKFIVRGQYPAGDEFEIIPGLAKIQSFTFGVTNDNLTPGKLAKECDAISSPKLPNAPKPPELT